MNRHTRICSRCRKELPINSFYYDKTRNRYDTLCRECRREYSRESRKLLNNKVKENNRTIITQVSDKQERLLLILRTKETIRKMILQKISQEREMEYRLNFD